MSELIYNELKGGAGPPPPDSGILLDQFAIWSDQLSVAFNICPTEYDYIGVALDEKRSVVAGVSSNLTDRLGAPSLWVEILFVRGKYERQGVGAALLKQALAATSPEPQTIRLINTGRALGFYDHLGFQGVPPDSRNGVRIVNTPVFLENTTQRDGRGRLAHFDRDPCVVGVAER